MRMTIDITPRSFVFMVAFVGVALGGVYVARANPGGATLQKLSFAGTLRKNGIGLPGPQTMQFTFKKGGVIICSPMAAPAMPDSQGAFTTEMDISAMNGCPANLFDGGDVKFSVTVGGTMVATDIPMNSVPYAKYGDQAGRALYVNKDGVAGADRATAGGGFCAETTTKYTGQITGGYSGAKAACKTACGGSETAHMCFADEMIRYSATGATVPAGLPLGWYATGRQGSNSNGLIENDCSGFTDASPNLMGSSWQWDGIAVHGRPSWSNCDGMAPLLCCD